MIPGSRSEQLHPSFAPSVWLGSQADFIPSRSSHSLATGAHYRPSHIGPVGVGVHSRQPRFHYLGITLVTPTIRKLVLIWTISCSLGDVDGLPKNPCPITITISNRVAECNVISQVDTDLHSRIGCAHPGDLIPNKVDVRDLRQGDGANGLNLSPKLTVSPLPWPDIKAFQIKSGADVIRIIWHSGRWVSDQIGNTVLTVFLDGQRQPCSNRHARGRNSIPCGIGSDHRGWQD